MIRAAAASLSLLLGLLPSCSPAELDSAPDPVTTTGYRERIALALQGDTEAAVAAALQYSPAQLFEQSHALMSDATCGRACLQAAVLVHTEASLVARSSRRRDAAPAQLRAAESLVESLSHPSVRTADEDAREFERLWRLALGYAYQESVRDAQALDTYDSVLKRFPGDPEALVALGALLEQAAAAPAFGVLPTARGTWANAAQCYERALAARPDYVEARLRLGHVARRQGRLDVARRALQQVFVDRPPAMFEALAHLFLGEVHAQQSRIDEAIEEYRKALRTEPRLQPAAFSLASVLQGAGRGPEAAAALLEALRLTQGQAGIGWYAYQTNLLHGYRASMEALWRRVRS